MNTQTFDYIVVGGGSAGCVMAARLTENPALNVLLLEAGHHGKGLLYDMPAGSFALMGNPKADWVYPTRPDPSADNRSTTWAAGKVMGGSSGINGMVYIRGQRNDYDDWRDNGCEGWGFDDLYPYFLKSECFTGPPSPHHGSDGPLAVSPPRVLHSLAHPFLEACGQTGMPPREEYCAGEQEGSFLVYGTTLEGKRCSARKAYIDPILKRRNLTVVTGALTDKVLFDGHRATGVRTLVNGRPRDFQARNEVILSAGTIGSPTILLRSGIGPGGELAAMGIPVVKDLPGVGYNLQEHCGVSQSRLINVPSYNTMVSPLQLVGHMARYLVAKKGILTSIAVHAMAYARSQPDVAEPDIAMSFLPLAIAFVGGHPSLASQPGVSIGSQVARPHGRGRIRLNSPAPDSKPDIEHALLSNARDLGLTIKGCKLVAEVFAAPALQPYVVGNHEPKSLPVSDSEWETYARQRVGIGYHPVGSCKMGKDAMAVVDLELQVHGTQGLRVIDASIMPTIISGNTNAPTIAIAEKAAEIVAGSIR